MVGIKGEHVDWGPGRSEWERLGVSKAVDVTENYDRVQLSTRRSFSWAGEPAAISMKKSGGLMVCGQVCPRRTKMIL